MNSQINQLLAPQNRQSWPITPNGVDTDYWSSPAPALGSASGRENIDRPGSPITATDPNLEVPAINTFHAVSAIRLMPRKRPLALIKFTERVNQILGSQGNLQLKIFGEGTLQPLLRQQRQVSQGQVILPGRQDPSGLLTAYRQADFFITLCLHESFGIAAAEARASGLPVIVRSQSPITDFIAEGVTGIAAESDEKLAEKTATALVNGKLKKLRENCKRQPSPVSWERCLQATLTAYEQAIEYRLKSSFTTQLT